MFVQNLLGPASDTAQAEPTHAMYIVQASLIKKNYRKYRKRHNVSDLIELNTQVATYIHVFPTMKLESQKVMSAVLQVRCDETDAVIGIMSRSTLVLFKSVGIVFFIIDGSICETGDFIR